jgi:hypothetical protein
LNVQLALRKITSLQPLSFSNFCEVWHGWAHLDRDSFPLLSPNCLWRGSSEDFCQLTILVYDNPSVQESFSWMFLALERECQAGQVGISAN